MSVDPARRPGLLAALSAVFWSFFGVRKRADHDRQAGLKPVHYVVAALLGAAIFIGALLLVVHLVVK